MPWSSAEALQRAFDGSSRPPSSEPTRRLRCHIRRQFQVAGEIDLHSMPFAYGDSRQTVEKSVHDLQGRLRGGITHAAGDDDRPVTVATSEPGAPKKLRKSTDQSHGAGRTEGCEVMLIDTISETRIADLVEAEELVKAIRSSVGHQQSMKGNSQPRLAECLDRFRFAEKTRASGNQDVPAGM